MKDHDELVPDPAVAREFGITLMTIWRWDRDEVRLALGWPPRLKIGRRNFRSRHALEAFKAGLIASALDVQNDDVEAARAALDIARSKRRVAAAAAIA